MMMPAPHFLLSAKDRLWLVLETHEGKWQTVDDLMFDAGFVWTRRDRLTAFTSFYWNLCRRLSDFACGQPCHACTEQADMTWKRVVDNAFLALVILGVTWSFSSCTARYYEAQYRCANLRVQL